MLNNEGSLKEEGREGIMAATYDKQFKKKAVRLSDDVGVRNASEQLGIPYYTLADWRRQRKRWGDAAFTGSGHPHRSKRQRECGPERKNAEPRQAIERLKDALGFFIKERRK